MQIINSYNKEAKGWKNHPIRIMWQDHVNALKYYVNCSIDEWVSRGYKNNMQKYDDYSEEMPWWIYWNQLHYSHQSSLLSKDYNYYKNFFDLDKLHENKHIYYGYIWINHLSEEHIKLAKQNIWINPADICFSLKKK